MTEFEKCLFWCEMIKSKAGQITEEWKKHRDNLQEILGKEEKEGETARSEN